MQNIKEYVKLKKEELKKYIEEKQYDLRIAIVQVGNNPASDAYVKGKLKDCKEVGIKCELLKFEEDTTEEYLLSIIKELNFVKSIVGFIVQLPLPKHINEEKIIQAISYTKDIDGFSKKALVNPATPQGIITYLEDNNFDFVDKNAVIIGRSNIVGRPMARLLLDKSCNVTVTHSKTSCLNLHNALTDADLVVVATGHRNTLSNYDIQGRVKSTCFLVDVGINRNEDNKLCGDCEHVTWIDKTPVPGGVGLLTRLALLTNIVKLYES